MPQKRNPDFAEAIKGKSHVVMGMAQALMSIDGSNLSGYNKDVQWSKYLFMDAVREAGGSADILSNVVQSIKVNCEAMQEAAQTGFLNAVDIADFLARTRDLPFRKTYTVMSEAVGESSQKYFTLDELNGVLKNNKVKLLSEAEFKKLNDPIQCLLSRDHIGSPNPKQLKRHIGSLKRKAENVRRWLNDRTGQIKAARKRCMR